MVSSAKSCSARTVTERDASVTVGLHRGRPRGLPLQIQTLDHNRYCYSAGTVTYREVRVFKMYWVMYRLAKATPLIPPENNLEEVL